VTFRALLIFVAVAACTALPASAELNTTVRVSLGTAGNQLSGSSGSVYGSPAISRDGNLIAFESAAASGASDTNGTFDVLFRDLEEQGVSLISARPDGAPGNNRSTYPAMSSNARYVAFESMASDLVEGDENMTTDIFLRDREEDSLVRVSVASDGGDTNGASSRPSVSASGSSVVFCSSASNLVAGDDNEISDAFLYDVAGGTVARVAPPDGTGVSGCRQTAVSADSGIVAFAYGTSEAGVQVYMHDVASGQTALVSAPGGAGNAESGAEGIAMSDDGGVIVFTSRASDLITGDGNGAADVFAWQADGTITRVSVSHSGEEGNGDSGIMGLGISGNGRYIVYSSTASNLVDNDNNSVADVLRMDRSSGQVTVGGLTTAGRAPNAPSYSPSVSDDGTRVAFVSQGSNIVYADRNAQPDVFLRHGGFKTDAGVPASSATPAPDDPLNVDRADDNGGIPAEALLAGAAAAAIALLVGSWLLLGRRGRA